MTKPATYCKCENATLIDTKICDMTSPCICPNSTNISMYNRINSIVTLYRFFLISIHANVCSINILLLPVEKGKLMSEELFLFFPLFYIQ